MRTNHQIRLKSVTVLVIRWIAVIPAGVSTALLVMFPIHWFILLKEIGPEEYKLLWRFLSAETAERLVVALTTPFFVVFVGAWTAPAYRVQTAVALAIGVAVVLGGGYVLTFTGGPPLAGWWSLHYGATPALNMAGLGAALYAVWQGQNE